MDSQLNEKDEGMLDMNDSRATLLGAISNFSSMDPSQWRFHHHAAEYLRGVDLSRWHPQQSRSRTLRFVLGAFTVLFCLYFWSSPHETYQTPPSSPADVSILNFNTTTTTRLPQIPPKIWQIYLSFSPDALASYVLPIHSWVSMSPSHTYSILDGEGSLAIISKLASSPAHAHILPLFYAMSRRVLRADFLRYLLLAIEGGVYSDIDTELTKPIHEWVPDRFKNRTRLIVGLEADQDPPVAGTTYPVQFCQWTLASAAGHPAMWTMVERILEEVKNRPFQEPPATIEYSDNEVLDITGPAGWTEVVFKYLNSVVDEPITWKNLTGMREPRLYGDVLVLPIDGFATGVPHSGASEEMGDWTMVKHRFSGAWRNGVD